MIVLQQIHKIYANGVHALRNLSLHVPRGTYWSIVGASGSGKTTLLQLLGCLDVPTAGDYLLQGIATQDLDTEALARLRRALIGFVFQSFRLSSDLTALENVALPLIFRGVPRAEREERAADALLAVGLGHRMQHLPCALSGGQQQRTAIARAMCCKPALLLADEPTGNLDPQSAREVLDLFDTLQQDGHTIVLITHDPAVAARAEHCCTMQNGCLYPTDA